MKQKLLCLGIGIGLCIIIGCGGGGGSSGDDENRVVAGTWRGALTLVENDCDLVVPATTSFTHTVNQNGDAVILVDDTNIQYLGNIVGDNGFSVDALIGRDETIGALVCNTMQRINYDGIDDDESDELDDLTDSSDDDGNPDTANVVVTLNQMCNNNTSCVAQFRGAANRGSTPPTDSNPTPTVADGIACSAVEERSYSGDGGCGISAVSTDVMGSIVVLEPLGVNGATSFVIDSTNPERAQSTGMELVINGELGFSCSLQCNGPLTFELECFKEGSMSCSEKF